MNRVSGTSNAFIHLAGVEPNPPLRGPFIGLVYQPWMIHDDCGAISGMKDLHVTEVLGGNLSQCFSGHHS
jgi:hypothetical protein